jgi:hypothetical protein
MFSGAFWSHSTRRTLDTQLRYVSEWLGSNTPPQMSPGAALPDLVLWGNSTMRVVSTWWAGGQAVGDDGLAGQQHGALALQPCYASCTGVVC